MWDSLWDNDLGPLGFSDLEERGRWSLETHTKQILGAEGRHGFFHLFALQDADKSWGCGKILSSVTVSSPALSH